MRRLSKKGQAITIELAMTAILMIVFCAIGFDMFFVVFGFSRLDSAARDAARAAGSTGQAPVSLQAAKAAASTYKTDGYFVTQPTVTVTSLVPDSTDAAATNYYGSDWNGTTSDFQYIPNPGRKQNQSGAPYVSVTTRCNVRLPVPIDFTNFFGASSVSNGTMAYARSYVYPILKVPYTPNQATAAGGGGGGTSTNTTSTNTTSTNTTSTNTTSTNTTATATATTTGLIPLPPPSPTPPPPPIQGPTPPGG